EEADEAQEHEDASTEPALAEAVDESDDTVAGDDDEDESRADGEEFTRADAQEYGGARKRRRRRRGRRGGEPEQHRASQDVHHVAAAAGEPEAGAESIEGAADTEDRLGGEGTELGGENDRRRRRRGRRGGRRNRRERENVSTSPEPGEIEPELAAAVS